MSTSRIQKILIGILILATSLSSGIILPVKASGRSSLELVNQQDSISTASTLFLPVITNGEAIPIAIPSPTIQEVNLSTISEFQIDLESGEQVVFEISSLSPISDPVLHLFDSNTDKQVAMDDNSGGGNGARLVYVSDGGRSYQLIVRSESQGSAGTGTLTKNGEVWVENVQFGGLILKIENLQLGETIQTVPLPNGAGVNQRLYFLDSTGLQVEARTTSENSLPRTLETNALTLNVVAGVSQDSTPGVARLVRNNAALPGMDLDFDGVGDLLEGGFGTCASLDDQLPGGFNCTDIETPADTDGDGLTDDLELFGKTVNFTDSNGNSVQENLLLPLWGADPRHKDMFIEVDFMRRTEAENTQGTALNMAPSTAVHFAKIYADDFTTDPQQRLDNAISVRNPDRKPGISVHFDSGLVPTDPAHATLYGDWGGFNGVDAVLKDSKWQGVKANDAWKDHMSPARRGVFRYALVYQGGGASCGEGFACAFPLDSLTVGAHEWGHSMRLAHSGPTRITGDIDPNCKPNYFSIMNYSYIGQRDMGFSGGDQTLAPPLNNAALTEWQAVDPGSTLYLDKLESIFKYYVDRQNGHVDWNHDGVIAPKGTTVRAYANFTNGNAGCEWTRYNRTPVSHWNGDREIFAASTLSPAMEHLNNRFYVFYSALGLMYYTHSKSSWDCPEPSKTGCNGATWETLDPVLMDAQQGLDVVRLGSGSSQFLLIVTVDAQGQLWQAQLKVSELGIERWTTPSQIPNTAKAVGEPSLTRIDSCNAVLAYKDQDNHIRTKRIYCNGDYQWDSEQLALDSNSSAIEVSEEASPAIAWLYTPYSGWKKGLYGALTDSSGRLGLWYFDSKNGVWTDTGLLSTFSGPADPGGNRPSQVKGRPTMAWMPFQNSDDFPGRFYLMYVKDDERQIRMQMSYTHVEENANGGLARSDHVGFEAPFDNIWLYAYGIDLLYEQGKDTNLRFIRSTYLPDKSKPGHQQIWLRPKADGIHDFEMLNYNDWTVLGLELCRKVKNPFNPITHPNPCYQTP